MKTRMIQYFIMFFIISSCQLINTSAFSNVPDKMSYQAIIKDPKGKLIKNDTIGIQISILQGSVNGTTIYTENQTPVSDTNGMISIAIGGGDSFDTIHWTSGPYFIRCETDPEGGIDYSISGTTKLLSVPYVMYAKTAENFAGMISETDSVFETSVAKGIEISNTIDWNNKLDIETQSFSDVLTQNNDGQKFQVKNIATPVDNQDVATKVYVDELKSRIDMMEDILINAGYFILKDVDGNSYNTVKIGNQLWMADNLKTKHYMDSTDIPYAFFNRRCSLTPAYYWNMNNEAQYKNEYGALYNFYTVMTNQLCPLGWHVPDNSEWDSLAAFLGGKNVAGGKMKEAGLMHWNKPNTDATNESGFTGLAGGWLDRNMFQDMGGFYSSGWKGSWWSGSAYEVNPYSYRLSCDNEELVNSSNYIYAALSVRCVKPFDSTFAKIPAITTIKVQSILQNTATSGGIINSDGSSAIILRGTCWSTSPNPDTSNAKIVDTTTSAAFTSHLTNLDANTTYYLRAFAINGVGIAFGNEEVFTTRKELIIGSVYDIDSNNYKTVEIGTQTWMAENLKTTRFSNGDTLPNITNATLWGNLLTAAYCDYNNIQGMSSIYGKLYNWYAVADPRNVCPVGWHMPYDADWTSLITYLEGIDVAGGKLKETGTTHWTSPNFGATNEASFTALPGGERYSTGSYNYAGQYGYWWSFNNANAGNENPGNFIRIYNSGIDLYRGYNIYKHFGLSIRCIKD